MSLTLELLTLNTIIPPNVSSGFTGNFAATIIHTCIQYMENEILLPEYRQITYLVMVPMNPKNSLELKFPDKLRSLTRETLSLVGKFQHHHLGIRLHEGFVLATSFDT